MQHTQADPETIRWLLAGDPAIRWQAERDLLDAPADQYQRTRALIPRQGWGAQILASHDPMLQWGVQDPKRFDESADGSALIMLQLLMEFGAPPDAPAIRALVDHVDATVHFYQGNQPFFEGETEACINGRVLSIGVYFGRDMRPLLNRLLGEQLQDGGWNCEAPHSKRGSVHSTLCVLEGIHAWLAAGNEVTTQVQQAVRQGQAYLLNRRLMFKLHDGSQITQGLNSFCYPHQYRYDALRALEYFMFSGHTFDARMEDALALVRSKQNAAGRWQLDGSFPESGQLMTKLEADEQESRWITLKALRVLRWADAGGTQ